VIRIFLSVLLVACCFACAEQHQTRTTEKPVVVATIPPLADWCRAFVGDAAVVRTLLPPGRSPHAYEPGHADAQAVADASLIVAWGGHIDDWLAPLARGSNRADAVIWVFEDKAHHPPHAGHDEENPHAWLDPAAARVFITALANRLIDALPASAADIRSHLAQYDEQVATLEARMTRAKTAWAGHGVVVVHTAWPAFMDACGVEILATVESESGAPPSAHDMQIALTALRSAQTPVVIAERYLSPLLANTLATESGATLVELDPLGETPHDGGSAYLDMMHRNLDALETVFGAIPPA